MHQTADDKVAAVRNMVKHGEILGAQELLDRIRAIIDDSPINRQPTAANPIHCCLCLNLHSTQVPAVTMIDGYALCSDCQNDVIERAGHIFYDANNQFAFLATVDSYRKRKAGRAL
jgi:hypothetical protein